jgi:hypothetical protein
MAWRYIIKVKPYWDKLNGNSYHSGAIFDVATEKQIGVLPFAYGDESMALHYAYAVISSKQSEHMHINDVRRMCFTTLLTDSGEQDCRDYGTE